MKCSPAVGAAALRSSRAKTVWYDSGSSSGRVMYGRQRHFADPVHDVQEPAGARHELHEAPTAVVDDVNHQRRHRPPIEQDPGARLDPTSRLHEAFPRVLVALAEQQYLHGSACLILDARQSRWKNSRLVYNEQVTGTKILGKIGERAMVHLPACAVDDHEAALIAWLGGTLGDQSARQLVVEVIGTHEPLCLLESESRKRV